MITSPVNSVNSPLRTAKPRQYTAHTVSGSAPSTENFDKITLSAREGEDPNKLRLQAQLASQVRTATTTGQLAALKEQVKSGEYKIDAGSIAKKLLLLGEV